MGSLPQAKEPQFCPESIFRARGQNVRPHRGLDFSLSAWMDAVALAFTRDIGKRSNV
jgi:hypothetical protein